MFKMTNFWRKNLDIFRDVKKKEIYFCYNTFVSYICWQGGFFFQEYIEIELKTFFVIFEGR